MHYFATHCPTHLMMQKDSTGQTKTQEKNSLFKRHKVLGYLYHVMSFIQDST